MPVRHLEAEEARRRHVKKFGVEVRGEGGGTAHNAAGKTHTAHGRRLSTAKGRTKATDTARTAPIPALCESSAEARLHPSPRGSGPSGHTGHARGPLTDRGTQNADILPRGLVQKRAPKQMLAHGVTAPAFLSESQESLIVRLRAGEAFPAACVSFRERSGERVDRSVRATGATTHTDLGPRPPVGSGGGGSLCHRTAWTLDAREHETREKSAEAPRVAWAEPGVRWRQGDCAVAAAFPAQTAKRDRAETSEATAASAALRVGCRAADGQRGGGGGQRSETTGQLARRSLFGLVGHGEPGGGTPARQAALAEGLGSTGDDRHARRGPRQRVFASLPLLRRPQA
ncbi:unnamed protein product [Lampetra fluviatilis]